MEDIVDVTLAGPGRLDGDLLLLGCFEGEAPDLAALPEWARERVRAIARRAGWKGREGQWAEGESGRDEVGQIALRGLGKRDALHVRKLGAWLGQTAAVAALHGVGRLVLALPTHALTTGSRGA